MDQIKVLSNELVNLVSAGEVIERPSSVVKELVENSIDANSSKITIEIKNGGKRLINVKDNGNGISRDNVRRAFFNHSTSKISEIDDLEKISTLGFRGEALSSICAVSKVELTTSSRNEVVGTKYVINGGKEISLYDSALIKGSSIIVRDLFYNVPARSKFLKKDVSEGNLISSMVDRLIFSHPDISFKFIRDDKDILSTLGDGNVLSVILKVLGKEFFDNLIEINYDWKDISVEGYIYNPCVSKVSSNPQFLFLNGRWIKDKIMSNAIECALSDEFQKKVPYIIYLKVPFDAVDVNAHPNKIEVRFQNEKIIFDVIYNSIKDAIELNKKRFFRSLNMEPKLEKEVNTEKKPENVLSDSVVIPEKSKKEKHLTVCEKNISKDLQKSVPKTENVKIENYSNIKFIGEIFDCFFVIQNGDNLILIDKHAAHERILFEKISSSDYMFDSQILVSSIVLNLSNEECECIMNNVGYLGKIGYKIENFGPGKIIIREIPMYIDKCNVRNSLIDFCDFFSKNKSNIEFDELKKIYAKIACKSSIKSGTSSLKYEIEFLVKKLIDSEKTNCPHGRPIYISISKDEIYKKFMRK